MSCAPAFVSAAFWLSVFANCAAAQTALPDHAVQRPFQARVTSANGRVTRIRDGQPWAISAGEQIPVQQLLATGSDGYAHFELANRSSFDLFANSRVVFRQNTATAGDLLDVISGRVRIHLRPSGGQPRQRIYTPSAIITAEEPATISLAVDEDNTVRIDVMEGEVKIQHTLLPSASPILVRAIDSVLVHPDQPLSYPEDHGVLYRYAVKPLVDLWCALTPGREQDSETTARFLARTYEPTPLRRLQSQLR